MPKYPKHFQNDLVFVLSRFKCYGCQPNTLNIDGSLGRGASSPAGKTVLRSGCHSIGKKPLRIKG